MSNNNIIKDFSKAVQKLEEIMKLEKNEVVQDSAIKRFEICFDLAWKSIKYIAKKQGSECFSPRECFKTAFQLSLVDYDKGWLVMLEDRNMTTHIYSFEYAGEVYGRLNKHLKLFNKLVAKLKDFES